MTNFEYSGHVAPASEPATRELKNLTITKLSVGPMDNNCYLLVCRRTGESLLIDAADDPGRIADMLHLGPQHPPLGAIVTTHQHADHWQALEAVMKSSGAKLIAHPDDASALPLPTDIFAEQGSHYAIGDADIEFVHLRGHTPGSLAVLYREPDGEDHLFTGDSLFPGGPGRTAGPPQFARLMDDLQVRVFDVLPDSTWVYPGHGDDTTLGAERPHLTTWRERGW
ncbi:MBL fold metallo-hydrolase [Nakamurella antarctica]|uniref:MBL fold metallo-hydrolase n=1 Tax=Nakamurella antarctica TaxID=1902245 RepID=A0A3G8ZKY0_9ACTN|nr:MBL fold metallo-hydrolase [Nakamurella antarctica]AZI57903.1 MBL fold metallo-hydrolase [Nakamurella antarctica]